MGSHQDSCVGSDRIMGFTTTVEGKSGVGGAIGYVDQHGEPDLASHGRSKVTQVLAVRPRIRSIDLLYGSRLGDTIHGVNKVRGIGDEDVF